VDWKIAARQPIEKVCRFAQYLGSIAFGKAAGKPIGVIRAIARTIILALLILASGTINTYITQYMTTYAENTLHVAPILFSPPQL
jgi:hypothetical protein